MSPDPVDNRYHTAAVCSEHAGGRKEGRKTGVSLGAVDIAVGREG